MPTQQQIEAQKRIDARANVANVQKNVDINNAARIPIVTPLQQKVDAIQVKVDANNAARNANTVPVIPTTPTTTTTPTE